MKIFVLEDNAEVFPYIDYLKEKKHEIFHVRNLKDAAYLLEIEPGVNYFDRYIFDAALISERVKHVDKGYVVYKNYDGFNGLLFLLSNLSILGENAERPERVAIITALANKLVDIPRLYLPDGRRYFVKKDLSFEEKNIIKNNQRVSKVRYETEKGLAYTFSFLDKTASDNILQIETFIYKG